MRNILVGLLLAAGFGLATVPTSAAPFSVDNLDAVGGVELVQHGGRCERLRRACEFKDERGERGEGNCRRYREECGGGGYCARLKRACLNKEDRGEVGQGNCRRWRNECGGR